MTKFKLAVCLMFVLVASVAVLPARLQAAETFPLAPTDSRVTAALDYLRSVQSADGSITDPATSAWAAMAIAAAGEDPHDWKGKGGSSLVDFLAGTAANATAVTESARLVLACAAAEEDPAAFGGVDLVARIEIAFDGSQIGDESLFNDDFWGLMALVAAGKNTESSIIQTTAEFITSGQNGDGGWSWGAASGGQEMASDVDDTAAAITALIAAGISPESQAIQSALSYMGSMQVSNGGFESWGATNSGTDAWAISALAAAGEDPAGPDWETGENKSPVDDLLSFQDLDGSFNWQAETPSNQALMTAYAIPALLGKPYPVKVLLAKKGVTTTVRIEGKTGTVWKGQVSVAESVIVDDLGKSHSLDLPTAVGALDEASRHGGFTYVVEDTAYGLYLKSVAGEGPEGWTGWMYRVNYESPMVGAADFVLGNSSPPDPPHEEVLFWWGGWEDKPLRITLKSGEVFVNEPFPVSVSFYDDAGSWSPLGNATVHAGQDYITGPDGNVTLTVDEPGVLQVYAEKDGYIRSDKSGITIAAPVLEYIEISPASASTKAGQTQQFRAVGTYSDGSSADITEQVSWTVSDETVASVEKGLARGLAGGDTELTATLAGVTSLPASLSITGATSWGIIGGTIGGVLAVGLLGYVLVGLRRRNI